MSILAASVLDTETDVVPKVRIRIKKVQIRTNPVPDPDPQHWLNATIEIYIRSLKSLPNVTFLYGGTREPIYHRFFKLGE
jgi:hypothetical protein